MSKSDYASRNAYHESRGPPLGQGGPQSSSIMPVGRTDGVLSRRLFAYFIDAVVITLLVLVLGFLNVFFSIITFGLAWALYAILVPGTAILYSALTIGGPSMGTVGMRMMGLSAVEAGTGGRASPLIAGLHALLFYVGIGTLLLYVLDILIGLARSDRRLGHDLLADIIVIRR